MFKLQCYIIAVSLLVPIQAFAIAKEPGLEVDPVIVLKGEQGTGKSTAQRVLFWLNILPVATSKLLQASGTILLRPTVREPKTIANRQRTVDLLPALSESNQHWIFLLAPRSLGQQQGLLCLIATFDL